MAGTQLEVTAIGSTITLLEDGVADATATDSALTGGAPGILIFGDVALDNWSDGPEAHPPSRRARGINSAA